MLDLSNNKYIEKARETSKRLKEKKQIESKNNMQQIRQNVIKHQPVNNNSIKNLSPFVQNTLDTKTTPMFAQQQASMNVAKTVENTPSEYKKVLDTRQEEVIKKDIASVKYQMNTLMGKTDLASVSKKNVLSDKLKELEAEYKNTYGKTINTDEKIANAVNQIAHTGDTIGKSALAAGWGAVDYMGSALEFGMDVGDTVVSGITGNEDTVFDKGKQITQNSHNYIQNKLADYKEDTGAVGDFLIDKSYQAGKILAPVLTGAGILKGVGTTAGAVGTAGNVGKKTAKEVAKNIAKKVGETVTSPVTAMFFAGAGGDYYRDAEQRGMSGGKALSYATLMSVGETASEMIGLGFLGKGAKALGVGKKGLAFTNYISGVLSNAIQEGIMEPTSEAMSQLHGGQYSYENILQRALKAGLDGATTYMMLGALSAGYSVGTQITSKVINGEQVTQQDIEAMKKEIEENGGSVEQAYQEFNNAVNTVEKQINQDNSNNISKNNNYQYNTVDDFEFLDDIVFKSSETERETVSELDNRNFADVGNKKIKAYQYENPKVKPYFQEMATYMLADLKNSIKGEKTFNSQRYYETNGDEGFYGTKRHTTQDIADLLDGNYGETEGQYKYSYKEIEKALNNIIEDNGKENNAVSKRIEILLDKRLREGYTDLYGQEIPANEDYIKLQKNIVEAQSNKDVGEQNKGVENQKNIDYNIYNDMKKGDIKRISPEEVLKLQDTMGHRTEKQINDLREYVKKNGLDNMPIEVARKSDGSYEINDGNHRLLIAKELGMKDVPIKLVDSWDTIGVKKNPSETNIESYKEKEYDRSNAYNEGNSKIANREGNSERASISNSNEFTTRETSTNDAEVFAREQKNNELSSSGILKEDTRRKLEKNSNKSSFFGGNDKGNKARSWTDTVKQNPRIQEAIEKGELKLEHLYYNPVGNKKSQQEAIATIISKGYEKAVEDFQNIAKSSKRITLNDIVVGEQLIIEAEKRGDVKTLVNLYTDVATLGTELGQMVQALSIIKSMKPANNLNFAEKLVNRINLKIAENQNTSVDKMLNKVEISKELQQELAQQTTQEGIEDVMTKISQDIAKQIPVTMWDKIDAWRYTSMLGNLRTHLRNMLGNTVMYVSRGGKNIVQRTVETLANSKLDERTKTFKKPSEYIKQYAKEMAQKSKEEIMGADKYSMEDKIYQDRTIFKNKVFEGARKLNTNMLKQEDWLFSRPAFTNSLAEYLTANNINTEQDINNNPEIVQKAIQYSINQAEKATFRQFSGFANWLSNFEKKNVATRIGVGATVPFKTTTANILKTGASYSPVGLAEALTVEAYRLKKGEITTNQFIERVSEGITGVGLTGLGILLSGLGMLTSNVEGDDEEHLNKVGELAPYSIKIGDTSFDVSYIAPTNIPVFLGKELYDLISKGEFEPKEIFDALQKSLDPYTELTLLGTINDALKTYNSNEFGGTIIGIGFNALTNYPTQFIPTLFGQVASSLDNTVRTTKKDGTAMFGTLDTFKRKVFNKIPFATYLNEPSLNVWGEEKKRTLKTGGAGVVTTIFNSFINPSNTTVSTASELDHELVRLYQQVGEDSIFPVEPQTYFNYNNEKYQMNAKEYTQFKKTYGQYAKIELTKLINKTVYKEASNKNKVKWIEDVYEKARNLAKKEYLNSKGIPFKY